MCKKSFSNLYTGIKKEAIWELWVKANNWLKWHTGLISCKMEDGFKVGKNIILDQEGVGVVKLLIAEIESGKKFVTQTSFFGAEIFYTRSVEEKPVGLQITYSLEITGPLKWWWHLMLKNKLYNCMAHDVNKLAEEAKILG